MSTSRRLLRGLTQIRRMPEILRCRSLTRDWIRLTMAYIGGPPHTPFSINLSSGPFEFRERSDIPTFWQVFLTDLYSVRPADRVIIDAGANIGAFTLYALLKNPNSHVVSVEPAPDSCDRLRTLISRHGVADRCTVVQAALSSETGSTTIEMCPISQIRLTGRGGVPVPSVTLDDLVAPYERVDLLKLDAEGAEYTALPAARPDILRRIGRIEMEYHPWGNLQELFQRLADSGFVLCSSHGNAGAPGYGMARLSRWDDDSITPPRRDTSSVDQRCLAVPTKTSEF